MESLLNGSAGASQYSHMSEMSPEWARVAPEHEKIERVIETLYGLPITEFRQVPYRPPPMPTDVPIPGCDISIREAKVPVRDGHDISIRIYEPLNLGQNHMLFFNIHGGGWTVGSPETEEAQNRLITAKNEAVVVSVDYRKAPEYPFPYALNDCYDVLLWCISSSKSLGVEKDSIILGGGSAGANIVAALAQIVRDEGINGIIGQVLNIPVTCHPDHFPRSKYEYGSYTQNANAPIVNAARMRLYWSYYLPSGAADSRASPLLARSLVGLPPALIQVAGMDPLRDEGLAYAQALKDSGVEVSLVAHPGLPHAFYTYPRLESTREYYDIMTKWIQKLGENRSEKIYSHNA